jgi:hypothetical protein
MLSHAVSAPGLSNQSCIDALVRGWPFLLQKDSNREYTTYYFKTTAAIAPEHHFGEESYFLFLILHTTETQVVRSAGCFSFSPSACFVPDAIVITA